MTKESTDKTKPQVCGLLRRLMIIVYDALVLIGLMMLTTSLMMLLYSGNLMAGKSPVYTAILILIWFFYLDWCWRHGGMTLGMRAWKVKLTGEQGHPFGWKQSILRFCFSLISALALGGGFIWCLFDREGLCWHDRISHSRLLRYNSDGSSQE
jgi:uncharacterized RDD family membrane protein YckC